MLRGFFLFLIFICNRKAKVKIQRFLFCQFQRDMLGDAEPELPLTDITFSRHRGSTFRWHRWVGRGHKEKEISH